MFRQELVLFTLTAIGSPWVKVFTPRAMIMENRFVPLVRLSHLIIRQAWSYSPTSASACSSLMTTISFFFQD